jgi:signal transduction histidine kinase
MKKRGFKSLYIKFVVMFVGILWFSSLVALRVGFIYVQENLTVRVQKELYDRVNLATQLTGKYSMEYQDLKNILESDYTEVSIYGSQEEFATKGVALTKSQKDDLETGKIVEGELSGHFKNPFVALKAGNNFIIITPNLKNNYVILFRGMISLVLTVCAALGSLLIVIAARMVVKPIKRLTAAAKEISKGNFDVKIETKSRDEVGQLADNFNIMTEELKNIEYLRKDFISSVSHEFKTPMTSIQGFAKLLKDKGLSSEQAEEYVDIIIFETDRLSNLSSNLLKLSKLENQAISVQHKYFSLDEQIRRVILLLENKWSEKDIEFDLNLDELNYKGDEELFYQVWVNLLTNAIKFSQQSGEIKITLKEESGKINLTIADKGIGIAEEDKDRIFEKFYKSDKSRSREGSGLGLSIVKKIIELHGGNISFESRLGYGTTFMIELRLI